MLTACVQSLRFWALWTFLQRRASARHFCRYNLPISPWRARRYKSSPPTCRCNVATCGRDLLAWRWNVQVQHHVGASVPGADLAHLRELHLVMSLELVILRQLEVCERESSLGSGVDGGRFVR